MAGCDDCRAVAGCDTAAEETRSVHWRFVGDCYNGDIGNDCVLREGRGAHEVQQILALALEAWCAVWHHTLALRCANLAAQIGLA